MRVVLQRVNHAAVRIDGETVGQIQKGYLLLVGLAPEDTDEQLDWMVHKIVNLRVFEDENGKLNRALADVNGAILSISQFTLYADVKTWQSAWFLKSCQAGSCRAVVRSFQ